LVPQLSHVIDASRAQPPPGPPHVARGIRVTAPQAFGLTAFALIVALAATGILGGQRDLVRMVGEELMASVEYPATLRYRETDAILVQVTNQSGRVMDKVTVAFDTGYIGSFQAVTFTPSASRPWEVDLTNVESGEHRRIYVQLEADSRGQHRGRISAFGAGTDTVVLQLTTLVFP
jgi:hypothetical protein